MPAVAVVGASRGIGRMFVDQYLADGWKVHATARRDNDIAGLKSAGAAASLADITDEASLDGFARTLPEVDVVIVNAGVNTANPERSIADIDVDEWMRIMHVNALGPVLAARALSGKIRKRGGKLVVLSSDLGSISENRVGGFWSYRMSKAALNMAASNLCIMLSADGIAVAALHPGWVKTDMGGPNAVVEPEVSVAGMRAFIASMEAGDERTYADYLGRAMAW